MYHAAVHSSVANTDLVMCSDVSTHSSYRFYMMLWQTMRHHHLYIYGLRLGLWT